MNWMLSRPLRPALLLAAAASALLNLALLVPAIYTLQVFERVFTSRSVETLVMLSLLVVIALVLSYVMDVLRGRSLQLASRVLGEVLLPLARGGALAAPAGAQRTSDSLPDVALLQRFVSGKGATALLDAPWLPLHLAVITAMHPWLGAAATAGACLLLGLGALTDRWTRADADLLEKSTRAARQRSASQLRQTELIAALGMGESLQRRWTEMDATLYAWQDRLSLRTQRLAATARVLRQALQAKVLTLGAWLVVAEAASPGIMVAATLLLGRALQPAQQIIASWKQFTQARGAWQRLAEPASAVPTPTAEPPALPTPRGHLQIERLVYGAMPGRTPLLRSIELVVPAGSSLGIVGVSGSGKSTLARLLIGLSPGHAGVVRLDGADIARWPRAALAPHLGWLPQHAELLAGSIAENIARMGEPDPHAVTEAARRAGAHEMIMRLPMGYANPVGDGGTSLSTGQRQQVALARALYGAPRLVVLDEPEAHLDADGEAALEGALQQLKADGATVVVVTHRRRLLQALDRVVVLADGVMQALPPNTAQLRPVARA